jgi:hypothetical protein
MLSGGSIECVSDAVVVEVRERDWMSLHREIKSVWKQRTALEAREVALLLDAEETRLFRRMGYATIYSYIEAELGYSHHVATERMRVGHELVALPAIAEEFSAGELPWSSVRELTRVVTPATEGVWLHAVEGKRADEVQRMVRGKGKGDLPGDPVDPSKIRNRIVLDDISEAGLMLWKQARLVVAGRSEAPCTNDALVRALAAGTLEPAVPTDRPSGPRFMHAVTTCRTCKQSELVGAGMAVTISRAEAERIACDCVSIGDLETNELTKPTSAIPAAIRRKVWVRDKGQCVVPGCTSCQFLEAHHLEWLSLGGTHRMENIALLCDAHHKQLMTGSSGSRAGRPSWCSRCRSSPAGTEGGSVKTE